MVNPNEMSTEAPVTPPSKQRVWQVPELPVQRRLLSGVSEALAQELGVDVLWIRISWILLFSAGGWGALLYLIVWGCLSWAEYTEQTASSPRTAKGKDERARLVGLGLVVIGLSGVFTSMQGLDQQILWPSGLMALGLLLSWRRFDPRVLNRARGTYPMAQAIGGIVLTAVGASLVVFFAVGLNTAAAVLYLLIGVIAALVLATSPWWWRYLQRLDRERQDRAVADERAVVAAHLHDSVLQTLSLIQRNSDNPQVMLNLARRQERELRNWLDPDRASRLGGSVRGYIDNMASEIEELYGTPVEVVAVGDCLVDQAIEHTLAATREAVVNAAKHAQTDQIDVYFEVTDARLDVFVRDRGIGFDQATIGQDRRGIRESIAARMDRIGGTVVIVSTPGEGTEVELSIARPLEPGDAGKQRSPAKQRSGQVHITPEPITPENSSTSSGAAEPGERQS